MRRRDVEAHGACFPAGYPYHHVPVRVETAACQRVGGWACDFSETAAYCRKGRGRQRKSEPFSL